MQAMKSSLLLFKYEQQIKVEGHGEYNIEVTSVVNPNTMEVQPIFPSLMSN